MYYGAADQKRRLIKSENDYALPVLAPSNDRFFCVAARGDLNAKRLIYREYGSGNLAVVATEIQ
jgi:hypothetical protein